MFRATKMPRLDHDISERILESSKCIVPDCNYHHNPVEQKKYNGIDKNDKEKGKEEKEEAKEKEKSSKGEEGEGEEEKEEEEEEEGEEGEEEEEEEEEYHEGKIISISPHSIMGENKLKSEVDENGQPMLTGTLAKSKLDPKDPLRPRRKKARRACFACQRAHLTCGDERPCQRCIKRGLADVCQDGVRKKAKYLHDAPPEALRPVLGLNYKSNYNLANHPRSNNNRHSILRANSGTSPSTRIGTGNHFVSEGTPTYAPIFSNQQASMPPPLQARVQISSNQQSPISPPFSRQEPLQNNSLSQATNESRSPFNGALFDPNNAALFNYDLEGLNFGNHYSALEFGILGNIPSSMADMSPKDQTGILSTPQGLEVINFDGNGIYGNRLDHYNQIYPNDLINYGNISDNQTFSTHQNLSTAYAVASSSQGQDSSSFGDSPVTNSATYEKSPPIATASHTPNSTPHNLPTPKSMKATKSYSDGVVAENNGSRSSCSGSSLNLGKRPRDSSYIYDIVKEPYSYTAGFHNLTAFLHSRFSAASILRIAQSIASIRPSFISCTKTLNRQDLIFMEKCFQRTLLEYEEFLHNCSTPTIVCRRTGEIAAVNKEFSMMTDWRRDVLLGKEPNLNVNMGKSACDNAVSGAGRGHFLNSRIMAPGLSTLETQRKKNGKSQPVLLAELLDDESVIDFYQDFSRLAFNDSRGSVMARCKVLKYCARGKEEKVNKIPSPKIASNEHHGLESGEKINGRRTGDLAPRGIGGLVNRVREIDGNYGIGNLERDGKLDCSYCWTVKRDVFDIPMLIVMNVSLPTDLLSPIMPLHFPFVLRESEGGVELKEGNFLKIRHPDIFFFTEILMMKL